MTASISAVGAGDPLPVWCADVYGTLEAEADRAWIC